MEVEVGAAAIFLSPNVGQVVMTGSQHRELCDDWKSSYVSVSNRNRDQMTGSQHVNENDDWESAGSRSKSGSSGDDWESA